MALHFWKGQILCRVLICRSGLPTSELTGELRSLALLLSVVSTKAVIVACSGTSVEMLQTLDQSPFFSRGVQNCFRFERLDLAKLIHKSCYSVFDHINYFSVLRGLVISQGGALAKDWVQRSPESARVSSFDYFFELLANLQWKVRGN